MFRKFTATALSLLLFFAAAISLSDAIAPGELFSGPAPEQMELFIAGNDDSPFPDYPNAIYKRLLRKRVSARTLFFERLANLTFISYFSEVVPSFSDHRTSPQDLYQQQTSLRI
jgi:hypothetical protein